MKCTFSKFRQAGLVDFNSKISILMPRSSPSRIQGYPQDERRQRVRERERKKERKRPDRDVQQSLASLYFLP